MDKKMTRNLQIFRNRCQWIDLNFLSHTTPVFTLIKSNLDLGQYFAVTATVHVMK
jgi:hypothetical protein